MALSVLLGGFYPVFVFFCGQALGGEENLLLDRPFDSRYANRLAQNAPDSGLDRAVQ